jgi:hypothetical protein
MATKKASAKQEPLLNSVARKLGHAAGALSKATHELTGNLAELPGTITAKMQQIANAPTSAQHPRTPARRPTKRKINGPTVPATKLKRKAVKKGKGNPRRGKSTLGTRKSSPRHK